MQKFSRGDIYSGREMSELIGKGCGKKKEHNYTMEKMSQLFGKGFGKKNEHNYQETGNCFASNLYFYIYIIYSALDSSINMYIEDTREMSSACNCWESVGRILFFLFFRVRE